MPVNITHKKELVLHKSSPAGKILSFVVAGIFVFTSVFPLDLYRAWALAPQTVSESLKDPSGGMASSLVRNNELLSLALMVYKLRLEERLRKAQLERALRHRLAGCADRGFLRLLDLGRITADAANMIATVPYREGTIIRVASAGVSGELLRPVPGYVIKQEGKADTLIFQVMRRAPHPGEGSSETSGYAPVPMGGGLNAEQLAEFAARGTPEVFTGTISGAAFFADCTVLVRSGLEAVNSGEFENAREKFYQAARVFVGYLKAANEPREDYEANEITLQDLRLWADVTATSGVFREDRIRNHGINLKTEERLVGFLVASLMLSSGCYRLSGPDISYEEPATYGDVDSVDPGDLVPVVGSENTYLTTSSDITEYRDRHTGKIYIVKFMGKRTAIELMGQRWFRLLGFSTPATRVIRIGRKPAVIMEKIEGVETLFEHIKRRLVYPRLFDAEAIRRGVLPDSFRRVIEESKLAAIAIELRDTNLSNILLRVDDQGQLLAERPIIIDNGYSFGFHIDPDNWETVVYSQFRGAVQEDALTSGFETNIITGDHLFYSRAEVEDLAGIADRISAVDRGEIEHIVRQGYGALNSRERPPIERSVLIDRWMSAVDSVGRIFSTLTVREQAPVPMGGGLNAEQLAEFAARGTPEALAGYFRGEPGLLRAQGGLVKGILAGRGGGLAEEFDRLVSEPEDDPAGDNALAIREVKVEAVLEQAGVVADLLRRQLSEFEELVKGLEEVIRAGNETAGFNGLFTPEDREWLGLPGKDEGSTIRLMVLAHKLIFVSKISLIQRSLLPEFSFLARMADWRTGIDRKIEVLRRNNPWRKRHLLAKVLPPSSLESAERLYSVLRDLPEVPYEKDPAWSSLSRGELASIQNRAARVDGNTQKHAERSLLRFEAVLTKVRRSLREVSGDLPMTMDISIFGGEGLVALTVYAAWDSDTVVSRESYSVPVDTNALMSRIESLGISGIHLDRTAFRNTVESGLSETLLRDLMAVPDGWDSGSARELQLSATRLRLKVEIDDSGAYVLSAAMDLPRLSKKEEEKMVRIHDVNNTLTPVIPEGKILWHVIPADLVPDAVRGKFIRTVNQMNRDPGIREKIRVVVGGEEITDVVSGLARDPVNIVAAAMLSADNLKGLQPGVKALVFQGETGDFRQIEGIVAALRALYRNDAEALVNIYEIMTGKRFTGNPEEIADSLDDPEDLARLMIFTLEPITRIPADELRHLNDIAVELMRAA